MEHKQINAHFVHWLRNTRPARFVNLLHMAQ